MKVITMKKLKFVDEGAFGKYYRIKGTNKGIKVIEQVKEDTNNYSTIEELTKSLLWKQSRKEYLLLKRAAKGGLAPKAFQFIAVKNRYGYKPGIIMQHLKSVAGNAEEALNECLLRIGINHGDLHSSNVMIVKEGKKLVLYAIDFSSDCSSRVKGH